MLSGHAYARALRSHFLSAAFLTALILDTSILIDGVDVRRILFSQFPFVMYLSRLQCNSERP